MYDSAEIALAEAVRLDSTFARAWYRLSKAREYGQLGNQRPAFNKAWHLRAQLPPHDRTILEARNALNTGAGTVAESLALAVIEADGSRVEAWWLLGGARPRLS